GMKITSLSKDVIAVHVELNNDEHHIFHGKTEIIVWLSPVSICLVDGDLWSFSWTHFGWLGLVKRVFIWVVVWSLYVLYQGTMYIGTHHEIAIVLFLKYYSYQRRKKYIEKTLKTDLKCVYASNNNTSTLALLISQ
ncbi:hypothetical protein ACJX0J_029593, partial [Zea mays]